MAVPPPWLDRDYQPRIQQLRKDIHELKRRIEEALARGQGMRMEWDREVGRPHP